MCCLAKHDKELFKADITEVSNDQKKVYVFLIDYGLTAVVEVFELIVFPLELSIYPGLVMLCHLRGIRSANGTKWSATERDASFLLLEVALPSRSMMSTTSLLSVPSTSPGALIFAESGGVWYRVRIIKVLPENFVSADARTYIDWCFVSCVEPRRVRRGRTHHVTFL